jgi:pyruvate,orthophosphate dikinase
MFDWTRPHKKRVYLLSEGSQNDKRKALLLQYMFASFDNALFTDVLGAKGANLCEMSRLGMPVPAAFIITAECSLEYSHQKASNYLSSELVNDYKRGIHELESQTGKRFGLGTEYATGASTLLGQAQVKMPLLLSVRAGSEVSMPGLVDTVLNLGINDHIAEHMARLQNNPRWAYDTYRRFLQMFGTLVLGADKAQYDAVLEEACLKRGVPHESLLQMSDLMEVVRRFKLIASVPDDPWQQLDMAVQAVFRSWNSPRAVKYRDVNRRGLSSEHGTAVTVQSMVYGNLNALSGSGVAFTRNPTTGHKELFGEYLANCEVSAGPRNNLAARSDCVFCACFVVRCRTLIVLFFRARRWAMGTAPQWLWVSCAARCPPCSTPSCTWRRPWKGTSATCRRGVTH